jgi:hypothetical protein
MRPSRTSAPKGSKVQPEPGRDDVVVAVEVERCVRRAVPEGEATDDVDAGVLGRVFGQTLGGQGFDRVAQILEPAGDEFGTV